MPWTNDSTSTTMPWTNTSRRSTAWSRLSTTTDADTGVDFVIRISSDLAEAPRVSDYGSTIISADFEGI